MSARGDPLTGETETTLTSPGRTSRGDPERQRDSRRSDRSNRAGRSRRRPRPRPRRRRGDPGDASSGVPTSAVMRASRSPRADRARPGPAARSSEERRAQVGEDAEGAGVDHDPLGREPERTMARTRTAVIAGEVGDVGDGLGAADEVGGVRPSERRSRSRRPPPRWRRAGTSRAWTPRAGTRRRSCRSRGSRATARGRGRSTLAFHDADRCGITTVRPRPSRSTASATDASASGSGGRSAHRGPRGRRRAGTPARRRSAAGRRSA